MALETNCAMLVALAPLLFATVHCYVFINDENYENCSALLDISLSVDESVGGSRLSQCPPWFVPDNLTGTCRSGPTLDGLIEQDLSLMQTSVTNCYCMTEENGTFSVGLCMHQCMYFSFYTLPCLSSQLEDRSCPPKWNRHGYLCTQCAHGYGFSVYSYPTKCVRCEDYQYNWLMYLAVAYLSLTLFYVFVTIFSINFTSPTLCGVVMMFQIVGNPFLQNIFLVDYQSRSLLIVSALVTFWNLDFFRAYYSFCLYPSASEMTIYALEFPLAIFPIFLIGVTFLLVKAHDHNFRVVIWMWKALQKIVKLVRRNVKTSLIEVFASFIYLSCSRLLLTSMYFLVPSTVYTYHPTAETGTGLLIKERHVMIAPSVKYFGKDHLLIALLAMVISTLFVIAPMLLLFLYPFPFFQRVLNRLGWNSLALRTFMDAFQGAYKNGTNGTKDYRSCSGFILLLPMMVYFTFIWTRSTLVFSFSSVLIILYLSLHLIFEPFQCRAHNYIMTAMLTALLGALWGAAFFNINSDRENLVGTPFIFPSCLIILSLCVPFVYLFGLAVVRLWNKISPSPPSLPLLSYSSFSL